MAEYMFSSESRDFIRSGSFSAARACDQSLDAVECGACTHGAVRSISAFCGKEGTTCFVSTGAGCSSATGRAPVIMPGTPRSQKVLLPQTAALRCPRRGRRAGRFSASCSVLHRLLFGPFLLIIWFFSSSPDVCKSRATTHENLRGPSTPSASASDSCRFPKIVSAQTKSLFPSLFPNNQRATQQKGLTAQYVLKAGRGEPPHGTAEDGRLIMTAGRPTSERNAIWGGAPSTYRKLGGARRFSDVVAHDADTPDVGGEEQQFQKGKAEKVRRLEESSTFKKIEAEAAELTESAVLGEEAKPYAEADFRKKLFTDKQRRLEQAAAGINRIMAAILQRNRGEASNARPHADSKGGKAGYKQPVSSPRNGGSSEGSAKKGEVSRQTAGASGSPRTPARGDHRTVPRLTKEQKEKIRRGVKFTRKFDFDRACEEAYRDSSVRLVWNIVYTDEHLMAQKLYEKMEAYVLRQYLALLKQERELEKIPIVGNPQLMRLVRGLLKREHIKTTKTDAQIAKLFRKVPRRFQWIPSADHAEEAQNAVARNRADEL